MFCPDPALPYYTNQKTCKQVTKQDGESADRISSNHPYTLSITIFIRFIVTRFNDRPRYPCPRRTLRHNVLSLNTTSSPSQCPSLKRSPVSIHRSLYIRQLILQLSLLPSQLHQLPMSSTYRGYVRQDGDDVLSS